MQYKVREEKREDRKAMRSIANQKQNIKLTKLKQTQRICVGGVKKIGYDPKSVEEFGGVVGWVYQLIYFGSHKYDPKHMYIWVK